MKRIASFILALAATLVAPAQTTSPNAMPLAIDADFPGGNILVETIEGDTVHLKPELKGTAKPWFYWYFRVKGAAGRTLTFVFDKSVMGVRGPGVSLDAGRTWKWLGADAVKEGTFTYAFPAGANEVRFSVGMPYLRADFDRFLARHKDSPFLQVETLTKTPKGRDVIMVRIGEKGTKARFAVAATARHHCCEMMASYILEGLLEEALANNATGRGLREHAEFLFVPFMDTDGVENGDQGKGRPPHDHNRDYIDQPIYAEVRALKEKLPAWSEGRPLIFFDLHDPALKVDIHETVHFLEPESRDQAQRLDELTSLLERDQQGGIIYSKQTTMRFGTGYNRNTPGISSGWARSLPNTILGVTMETAYANAGGCEVNADSARDLGRDLAFALQEFLKAHPELAIKKLEGAQ
ncbi:MAG: hypothetical protein IT578_08290 [Verrucomicrobiae bacterium]|nr:hypothetical protein [Verrucomicrobiae bacterium]